MIVEDGSGVPGADAFVSVADVDQYASDYGADWALDEQGKESAIRRASAWLSSWPQWDGSRTHGRSGQGLAWPRRGVRDCDGDLIPDDQVPHEVRTAAIAAALYEAQNPGGLTPDLGPLDRVTSREKVDVIEVSYFQADDSVDARRSVLTSVHDHIRCLVRGEVDTPRPLVV